LGGSIYLCITTAACNRDCFCLSLDRVHYPIIACEGIAAKSVTADPVSCTAMSMVFFDRLYDDNVVRESGHIVKCFDDFYEDFVISDELRKAGCLLVCLDQELI